MNPTPNNAGALVPQAQPLAFHLEGLELRALTLQGEPWFVLSDVAKGLGHASASRASRLLEDEEKGDHIVATPGGPQSMTCVSEAGLYRLVMCSRKAQARVFQRWVVREVLPSIRRHGLYFRGAERLGAEDLSAVELMSLLAEVDAQVAKLKAAELLAFAKRQERLELMAEEQAARRRGLQALKRSPKTKPQAPAPLAASVYAAVHATGTSTH